MIDRIKRDKEVNWNKAINFIPKENEVIIYDCDDDIKIKVGDGITTVIDLPFSNIINASSEHKVENNILYL